MPHTDFFPPCFVFHLAPNCVVMILCYVKSCRVLRPMLHSILFCCFLLVDSFMIFSFDYDFHKTKYRGADIDFFLVANADILESRGADKNTTYNLY